MRLGVQFTRTIPAGSTRRYFTHSWPESWRVLWIVVPKGPVQNSAPQVEWDVQVERQTTDRLKYFIQVRNLSAWSVEVEARYAVLD